MADDSSQIWVGEDKIGLRGLKEAIEEIARVSRGEGRRGDPGCPSGEIIREELHRRVAREKNMARHSSGSLENSWANRAKKHREQIAHCGPRSGMLPV